MAGDDDRRSCEGCSGEAGDAAGGRCRGFVEGRGLVCSVEEDAPADQEVVALAEALGDGEHAGGSDGIAVEEVEPVGGEWRGLRVEDGVEEGADAVVANLADADFAREGAPDNGHGERELSGDVSGRGPGFRV